MPPSLRIPYRLWTATALSTLLVFHATAQTTTTDSTIAESTGAASYSAVTTVSATAPVASGTMLPLVPTNTVPAVAPSASAYVLNSTFEITDTAATRTYDWVIGIQTGTPDGYNRSMITINGQMPGPLIEANEGDTIVVNVNNALPNETTSIHWHGIYQNGTAYMDGVPGVSQCPIPAGGSFTYTFTLQQYGTYWYHSHSAVQFTDGLLGPLIVHSVNDPLVRGTDFDYEQVVIVQDWYHDDGSTIVNGLLSTEGYHNTSAAPSPQSGLINGVGVYDCSDVTDGTECVTNSYPEFTVTPNATTRFRLINGGSHAQFYFSVDEHTLDVIEADGVPVSGATGINRVPYHNGQRYSVIVNATVGEEGDAFWMRAEMNTACFNWIDSTLNSTAFGIIRYGSTDSTTEPTTSDWSDALGDSCVDLDDSDLVPLETQDVPATAAQRAIFDSAFGTITYNGVSYSRFFVNDTTYTNYIYQPFLNTIANGSEINSTNVAYATFDDDTWAADIVINNLDQGLDHPYHLHGQDFWIVARGSGELTDDLADSLTYNVTNPVRRDTLVIPGGSYAVLRITNSNPGVWVVHCHIAWHLAEGFLGVIVSNPNAIADIDFPTDVTDLCNDLPVPEAYYETEPGRRRSLRELPGLLGKSMVKRAPAKRDVVPATPKSHKSTARGMLKARMAKNTW